MPTRRRRVGGRRAPVFSLSGRGLLRGGSSRKVTPFRGALAIAAIAAGDRPTYINRMVCRPAGGVQPFFCQTHTLRKEHTHNGEETGTCCGRRRRRIDYGTRASRSARRQRRGLACLQGPPRRQRRLLHVTQGRRPLDLLEHEGAQGLGPRHVPQAAPACRRAAGVRAGVPALLRRHRPRRTHPAPFRRALVQG